METHAPVSGVHTVMPQRHTVRHAVELVSVFAAGPGGGNPAPIVVDAAGMSDAHMQEVARRYGHESGFVLPAPPGSDCDYEFRFWVPNHEMPMCGHATVGAVWLLHQSGRLQRDRLTIQTRSGKVGVRITGQTPEGAAVEISQPAGRIEPLTEAQLSRDEILDVLGISRAQLAPLPIQNACTSRVKTLIPLTTTADLDSLAALREDRGTMRADRVHWPLSLRHFRRGPANLRRPSVSACLGLSGRRSHRNRGLCALF